MKILIIEDDEKLCRLLARGLAEDGHVVHVEYDGVAGAEAVEQEPFDTLVVDIMLPRKDGLTLVRELRERGHGTPILMLTARDTIEDVIAGLDAGADDYLRKPFAFEELEARLRSLTRRPTATPRTVLAVEDLIFDLASKRVKRGDREIELTARELAFLEYFMKNAGIVLTRTMLEKALWDREAEISSNVIDVYVRRLRAKLDLDGFPPLITTIRGVGYRLGSDTP